MRLTQLHAVHARLGAKFTPFAGWQMPVRYDSEIAEHHAVRRHAGLFDLSHMGQIEVTGPEASRALDYALTGHISTIDVGGARYTMMCDDNGGIVDDLVAYRLADERFLVVANAGNTAVVLGELRDSFDGYAARADLLTARALIAVQGPRSAEILSALTTAPLAALRYYTVLQADVATKPVLLARTGYTGEDGFEIFCDGGDAARIWSELSAAGAAFGLRPAGLACRDTLRMEAGMPLYGNELHAGVTPFDAGLGRVVVFAKPGDFVGRSALAARSAEGSRRILVGLVSAGRRVARPGHAVVDLATGEQLGSITSGAPSPTLNGPIALGYVDASHGQPGREVGIDIRGGVQPFTVTRPRFYQRSR